MKKWIKLSVVVLAFVCFFMHGQTVFAKEADIHFGSEQYEQRYQEEFFIGMYLESEDTLGKAEVLLQYDPSLVEFVSVSSGSMEVQEDGVLCFTDEVRRENIRYMIRFRPIAAGHFDFSVKEANIADSQGEEYKISTLPMAPVHIKAKNEAVLDGLKLNETEIVWDMETMTGQVQIPYAQKLQISSQNEEAYEYILSEKDLLPGENVLSLTVRGSNISPSVYTLKVTMEEEVKEIAEEQGAEPEEVETTLQESEEEIVASKEVASDVTEEETPSMEVTKSFGTSKLVLVFILIAGVLIVALVIWLVVAKTILVNRKEKRRLEKMLKEMDDSSEDEFELLYEDK